MANKLVRNLFFHIQKRFLNASATGKLSPRSPLPTTSNSSSSTFTVQFLVKSCGLPLKSARSVSRTLQLDEKNQQRYQSVMELLKSHNFSGTQVAKLIVKKPAILQCRVENNLFPKFNYLKENGFAGELLPELFLSNPVIIQRALNSHIKPTFDFLRSVLDSDDKVVAAIRRSSWLLTSDLKGRMQPNIDLLVKVGVPAHSIEKIVILQPRVISQNHDRMVHAVHAVNNLGIQPTARRFVHAVRVMMSMSDFTWKKKFELLKNVGWSEEEIFSAFKKKPHFLASSEEKFKNAMDFYLNTMKLQPQTLIASPIFLMHSVDKRLRPRYNVLQALESKKLIEGRKKIEWLLLISEKNFQKNFVSKYAAEVPGLLEMYLGTRNATKRDTC
ncbi:hypothetical protein JCGZ_24592 [Jatropha curcas]|uniref:Uncharacterized protein n=1 Tax=Jatropha curcas TaxID=180498 RepID=A0A067L028_JATCU|nr:uncharacterized protein LOC105631286 [Jatropha curcas]KDP40593.1 hypothetical protein JCGZ_24592 [Jatropha curcas]